MIYNIKYNKNNVAMDIQNCLIKGNTVAYKLHDGQIFQFKIDNGNLVDKKVVESIKLNNYQVKMLDYLKNKDGDSARLCLDDIENIDNEILKKEMHNLYRVLGYSVSSVDKTDESITLKLKDKIQERNFSLEFEDKSWWDRVCDFFSNACNVVKKIWKGFTEFFSNDSENLQSVEEENANRLDKSNLKAIFPNIKFEKPYEYVVKGDEKINVLANDIGVSKFRIVMANPDINFDMPLQKGQKIMIPAKPILKKDSVKNIEDVAKITGISKNYIKDILFTIEGRDSKPALVPYYDGVKDENHPKGYLTIGFGHTGRVDGVEMNSKNKDSIKITQNKAYELLSEDVLKAKLDAIDYFGNDFLKAPKSIQDGIIDIFFNKGIKGFLKENSPTNFLKENLANEDYISAALNMIYDTELKGLKKRNIARVITSMKDLPSEDRKTVIEKFEPYYDQVQNLYKKNKAEYKKFDQAWNNLNNDICYDYFS